MTRLLLLALVVGLLAVACSSTGPRKPSGTPEPARTSEPADAQAQLDRLLDAVWALDMQTFPTWATYEGVRDYDDRLADVSDEAQEAYLQQLEKLAAEIEEIDPQQLSSSAQDTRRMVLLAVRNRRARQICRSSWWDVNGLNGPQVDYPMLPVFHTIRNETDLTNLETRYRAIDRQIDQYVANLSRGVAHGYAPAQVNAQRVVAQLDRLLETPIDEDPMLRIRATDPEASYDVSGLRQALEEVVRPALERYRNTIVTKVLPVAREDRPGVVALPEGEACYRASIAHHIGPGYEPEQLHARGLEELERMHEGMVQIGAELGLQNADAAAVIAYMVKRSEHYAQTEEELLEKNQAVVERAREAIPRAFGRLPTTPVEVRPLEAHRAADAPAAYYYGAPEDGSRPAIYYVNTSKPHSRPLFNLEALAFHEAIPGHHLQIALAQEIEGLHVWRRNAGQTAFVEGWALYAELLADELDLYSDPTTRFGMYNYQAWRAARLVIDTGLHAMGWSREQAIAFLEENTSLPRQEVENEVDRYIAWPGQALAYMVGRLAIEDVRREAEQELGERFDLRAFHDALLGRGAVPLTIMRENMREWIARTAASGDGAPPR